MLKEQKEKKMIYSITRTWTEHDTMYREVPKGEVRNDAKFHQTCAKNRKKRKAKKRK